MCFNVDAGAVLHVPVAFGGTIGEFPPRKPPVTDTSLMLHSDLLRLGLYSPPRRPQAPVVLAMQRPNSRTFLNFTGLIMGLSTQISGSIQIYHGTESLRETIKLFSRASVVWGYHGAGFANMVFSRPGTTAIEIFTRACGHGYPGFNHRTIAVMGGNWRVLNIGAPRSHRKGNYCKPRYVAWGAQDLLELSSLINEEISRR